MKRIDRENYTAGKLAAVLNAAPADTPVHIMRDRYGRVEICVRYDERAKPMSDDELRRVATRMGMS